MTRAKQKRFIQKLWLIILLMAGTCNGYSQDAYMNLTDTANGGLFKNFIGIKLFAADYGVTTLNQNLEFNYVSNNLGNVYQFLHDMDVRGVNSFPNIGLGMDENVGKHLSINFFNASIGYTKDVWNWNASTGVGYFVSLNKAQTIRLTASLNISYECITYSFGSDYDPTELGFIIDGVNVGSALNNVKYVASIWSLSPSMEFMYRRNKFDFFADIGYNYVFAYSQEINFYIHSIPTDYNNMYGILNQAGTPVSSNILNTNKYFIQVGIIREFGL